MTLNEAAQKNNGFERPVAYFKLNDAPLSGESLIYHDVRVTLTAGMEASDCTAEIVGQYSRFEDGELVLDAALESIVLGAKLEVFLGYGDSKNAESVFVGYVSSTELVVEGEKTSLIVTASTRSRPWMRTTVWLNLSGMSLSTRHWTMLRFRPLE